MTYNVFGGMLNLTQPLLLLLTMLMLMLETLSMVN